MESERTLVRLSAKMFNMTPAQLPAHLKARVLDVMQSSPDAVNGSIRPGCVHLTIDALLSPLQARIAFNSKGWFTQRKKGYHGDLNPRPGGCMPLLVW